MTGRGSSWRRSPPASSTSSIPASISVTDAGAPWSAPRRSEAWARRHGAIAGLGMNDARFESDRNLDREAGPRAERRVHGDAMTKQLGRPFHDRQAKADAAPADGGELPEFVEDHGQLVVGDADTGILHLDQAMAVTAVRTDLDIS